MLIENWTVPFTTNSCFLEFSFLTLWFVSWTKKKTHFCPAEKHPEEMEEQEGQKRARGKERKYSKIKIARKEENMRRKRRQGKTVGEEKM